MFDLSTNKNRSIKALSEWIKSVLYIQLLWFKILTALKKRPFVEEVFHLEKGKNSVMALEFYLLGLHDTEPCSLSSFPIIHSTEGVKGCGSTGFTHVN